MSRHGYSEGDGDNWSYIMYSGQLASAVRGKRGQSFFKDLVVALEEMPLKRLVAGELRKDGEVCALGALGIKRGMNLEKLDPEDYEIVACEFNIATQLAREVVWQNDEVCDRMTPENRWNRMHLWASSRIKKEEPKTA